MTTVRTFTPRDWCAVERIYAQGIAAGNATFEAATPAWEAFDGSKLTHPRFVSVDDEDAVTGWVAASLVSSRPAYRGVIEHSVYVAEEHQGRGIGRRLLEAFIDAADEAGYWTIQSSIFPENTSSARLHASVGFRVVGRRKAIAQSIVGPHAGQWRDTLLIERRAALEPVAQKT